MNPFSGHCKGRTIKNCRKTKHCSVYKKNGKSQCRKLYGFSKRSKGGRRKSRRRQR